MAYISQNGVKKTLASLPVEINESSIEETISSGKNMTICGFGSAFIFLGVILLIIFMISIGKNNGYDLGNDIILDLKNNYIELF